MYCPHCGVANPTDSGPCRICGKEMAPPSPPIKCPRCGTEGQEGQQICAKCGAVLIKPKPSEPVEATAPLVAEPAPEAPAAEEPAYEYETTSEPAPEEERDISRGKWCPQCGRPKEVYADLCDYCMRQEEEASAAEIQYVRTSDAEYDIPKVAGLLIVFSGLLGIIYGILAVSNVANSDLPLGVSCFTALIIFFGMIAIVGGVSAVERKNAMFAAIGGIFGLLSIGFYIGSIMGLVGLLLVIKSYREFEVQEISLNLFKWS